MDKTSRTQKKEANYFVSGSNHAGEIRGLSLAGLNVGVAAPELNAAAERELGRLAGTGLKVFVDSGAFGEITFENGPRLRLVKWGQATEGNALTIQRTVLEET